MPFISILLFFLMLGLNLFQLAAVQAGLNDWWDVPGWLGFSLCFFALLWLGPLMGLLVSIVGFFAAMDVWRWEWWQAAMLCFPTLIIGVGLLFLQGVAGVGSILFNRRREY